MEEGADLKLRTARTLKWNVIDRVLSQVLYAVTGVVLARVLSQEDFGLVGAMLVFQAFASLFVDSGFGTALLQRKSPTHLDYSTVMWFNVGMSVGIYTILWFCAPLIADIFQGDQRLIPLSRVMFLSFIINALSIVQVNRLMKRMDVKMIAVSNTIGLIVSAVVGIWMALTGWGAWAIVWQTIALATTKTVILWLTSNWRPLWKFSWSALRSFFGVGSGVMLTSFLNTVFQNLYSFFIGNRVGLVSLGYYTQADKWSKMGIMSLSQVLTASFLPVLSQVQDDPERYARMTAKMNRFTAYLLFPAMGFLVVMATPIFHALFGTKWDASIILFQILLVRGVFTVLSLLYNNFILALGRSRLIVYMEILRDGVAILALIVTLPYMAMTTASDPVWGLRILLWGQLIASALTWLVTLIVVNRLTHRSWLNYLKDCLPYLVETIAIMGAMVALTTIIENKWLLLAAQGLTGLGLYLAINAMMRSQIQRDALDYILHRFRKKRQSKKSL